jgi:hypothetical protein
MGRRYIWDGWSKTVQRGAMVSKKSSEPHDRAIQKQQERKSRQTRFFTLWLFWFLVCLAVFYARFECSP